jgi:hypothetical protein
MQLLWAQYQAERQAAEWAAWRARMRQGGLPLPSADVVADVAGIVPGFGEPIDVLHAGSYLLRRRYKDAGLTAVGVIPVLGDTAKGLKYTDEAAAVVGAVTKHGDEAAAAAKAGCSFSGETLVSMSNGTARRIADVKVGDRVLATDPTTGETGGRTVLATLPHIDELLTLETSAGDVITTEDHKYWNATDQQWQQSQHLDTGDKLLTAGGEEVTVRGLDWSTVQKDAAYDLTVADLHTYYVAVGGAAVLVHNSGCDDVSHAADRHLWEGTNTRGKSAFFDGSDLAELARRTDGRTGFVQPNNNTRYVIRGDGPVGVDRTTGLPTDIYTVIRKPDGTLVTLFPGTSPMG